MIVMRVKKVAALSRLFDETTALCHRLRAVAGDLHGADVPSAGRRGILRSLDSLSSQTVPQLARARPVSRQHVQMLVNGLLLDGLIVAGDNPAHRKSPLLQLTPQGKRQLEAMREREVRLLAKARLGLDEEQIDRAVDTLRAVRCFLESEEWTRYVAGNEG
jgi:DNA-binding MarR family transcriptional regulator